MNPPKNENYCATVVVLKDFVTLPGLDNLKAARIFGNSVLVGKEAQVGDVGLFFPVEVQLSQEYLAANGLYRKPEWGNLDPDKKGFFEQHGRVKAIKFRGHKSEGFFIPLASLDFILSTQNYDLPLPVGSVFDSIGNQEICRKYVPKTKSSGGSVQGQKARLEDSIVDNQFRLHYDCSNLRRNVHKIQPTDFISISDKWHGTSVVIGKLLVKRQLSLIERVLKAVGVKIQDQTYGLVYSSRRVIKAVNGTTKAANHYYSEDIWGIVAKEVEDKIPNGFTLYGEIVGYTPNGSEIQKGYHYGCVTGAHRLLIYRVTLTNADGLVFELPWVQMGEFCAKYGFESVKELWYGKPDLWFATTLWNTDILLSTLEGKYARDQKCPYNNHKVPAEGIVVRIDRLHESEAFKLKNFAFLERESKLLDAEEVDLETSQSEVL